MAPILSVKDVGVVLDGKNIVEAISFELAGGDNLAIIGPNGSGKTVLLRALLGIVPYTGAVAWAPGVKVGYVPQKIEADRHLPLSIGDLLRAKARVVHLPSDRVRSVADVIGLTPEILEKPIGRGGRSWYRPCAVPFPRAR